MCLPIATMLNPSSMHSNIAFSRSSVIKGILFWMNSAFLSNSTTHLPALSLRITSNATGSLVSPCGLGITDSIPPCATRSEEHTSELQSRGHLVCRLLLEKKKKTNKLQNHDHIRRRRKIEKQ